MKPCAATGAVAAWCLLFVSSVAVAQTARGSDRPYRALFGRGSQGMIGQSLDLTATLVEAYDDNLLAEGGGITPGTATLSGEYSMLQTSGNFAWTGRRAQLGITGASAFRYYGQIGEFFSVSHSAGVGLSTTLAKRTTLSVNQAAANSPSYLSQLFPALGEARLGDAPPASPNYSVDDSASYSYRTSVALVQGVSRRGSLNLVGDYSYTDFHDPSRLRQDGSSYGARAEFSRSVGRHSAVGVDYRYRAGDFGYGVGGQSIEHGVGVNVQHTKVLSATRTAVFAFGIGAARSTVPPLLNRATLSAPDVMNVRLIQVTGSGSVAYQFSRKGALSASYRRGVDYIVELAQPVAMNGVSFSVSGSPTRRLDLIAGAGYSSGSSALQQTAQFDTYTADVQTRVRITRILSGYVEYLYYFYDFGANPLIAPNLPRRLERNGVRVGVTLSAPLLRR